MTVREFSDEFDVLVSSYRRFRDFDRQEPLDTLEFNEYEKSLYLTKAQETLVLSLYNGRNSSGESFEETEELRRYLAGQVGEAKLEAGEASDLGLIGIDGGSDKSAFFKLPKDLWFITYESVKLDADDRPCAGVGTLEVVPVTQDEYHRIRKNPFRGANDRRALRLDLDDDVVEILSKYTVDSYYVRYLRKLTPIVLVDLPNGLSVDGVGVITECVLHDGLHRRILELGVDLALRSKGVGTQSSGRKKEKDG